MRKTTLPYSDEMGLALLQDALKLCERIANDRDDNDTVLSLRDTIKQYQHVYIDRKDSNYYD